MNKSPESVSIFKQCDRIIILIDNTRGDVEIHHAGHTAETGKKRSPEKPKSTLLWNLILGAASGVLVCFIASTLLDYYAEPLKNNPILLVTLFVIILFTTIFIRHKISKSET